MKEQEKFNQQVEKILTLFLPFSAFIGSIFLVFLF